MKRPMSLVPMELQSKAVLMLLIADAEATDGPVAVVEGETDLKERVVMMRKMTLMMREKRDLVAEGEDTEGAASAQDT